MAAPQFAVIVPGLMDSGLILRYPFGKKLQVWFNPTLLAATAGSFFQLAADGLTPGPLAAGQLEVGGVLGFKWLEQLRGAILDAGIPVVYFPYDWRLSILQTGASFADFLLSRFAKQTFAVVAHSLGGLVAQIAYPLYIAAAPAANWTQTVTIATPFGGSYLATQALAGLWNQAGPYLSYLQGLRVYLPLVSIPIDSAATAYLRQVSGIAATFPALYELMPSVQPTWKSLDLLAGNCWELLNYSASNPAVTQERLTAATATQVQLEAIKNGPQPPMTNYFNNLAVTPAELVFGENLNSQAGYGEGAGDGVVPAARANLAGQS